MHSIGHQTIESSTFVDFIESGERLTSVEDAFAVTTLDRRALGVVQRTFHEIAGRHQVLQALLILNSDRIAAKIVSDPHRGNVHFALFQYLIVGQITSMVGPRDEREPSLFHPLPHCFRFTVFDLSRLVIEGRLTEPLFEHSCGIQQTIGNDGIEHSHTTFVENSHNCFLRKQVFGKLDAQFPRFGRNLHLQKGLDVTSRVFELARGQPFIEPLKELRIGKSSVQSVL